MNGTLFYLTTLLVYAGVDILACLGLSMQFGVAGVTNFGFIIFQAAGAYTAGVLSLGSDKSNGAYQSYIGGLHLPFPCRDRRRIAGSSIHFYSWQKTPW
jgi:ABC-type branched-subunit amino acid transport system permease subunit